MEPSYKQFVASVTKWANRYKSDEFFVVRLRLTFFYSLTAVVILAGSSIILYNALLAHLTETIQESMLDPQVANLIMIRTQEILQDRFITINAIIVCFIVFLGFFLTQKTLRPIKVNMQKQKRFIADASHELRTPIAVVISGLEVALRNKNLDVTTAKKTIENTLTEMKEFSVLTNDLLNMSKDDASKRTQYAIVAINELVINSAEKIKPLATEKGIHVHVQINNPAHINGDTIELQRVFYNILDNAITHTQADGSITISDKIISGQYYVTIEDTGTGIPENILDKIFDPFFQGNLARNTKGAGLGLALVKKIIENHQGSIEIKSNLNKGTKVIISLPVSS